MHTQKKRGPLSVVVIVLLIVALVICTAWAANQFDMFQSSSDLEPAPQNPVVVEPEDTGEEPADQAEASAQVEIKEPEEPVLEGAGIKVCLDAGHGGKDPGTNIESRMEKDDVLKLALATKEAMEAKGVEVIMTRTDDTFVDLHDRCIIANEAEVDYFISLHRNSYSDSSVCGVEIWKSFNASEEASQLADEVSASLQDAGVQNNRGVYEGSQSHTGDYLVLRETAMPSLIVEMGFVTNEKDNHFFDNNQEAYAEALTQAVLDTYTANHSKGSKGKADKSDSKQNDENQSSGDQSQQEN